MRSLGVEVNYEPELEAAELTTRLSGVNVLIVRGTEVTKAAFDAGSALNLVIRAGGFAVAALDVADVPARVLRELPWTTWLRLAHANEGRRTVCLLVGDAPMGKSARGASVRLAASRQWAGDSLQSRRFAGLGIRVA